MQKITFCLPSKSNLRYLKTAIPSIRENGYRSDHDIIIFVDSDEDGTVEWLEENGEQYGFTYYINPYIGERLYGIGKAYDFCIEKSTTDIFMIFHADMILGKNADFNAFQQLEKKSVVCSTRIEPPLHPNGGEKILEDFGMWPEEFKKSEFDSYVQSNLDSKKITEGVFAPWMMYKEDFLSMGGHDSILHSCREDSDVFNRMLLNGFQFKQVWSSLVYHFTGRGAGSFGGDEERHQKWKLDMNRSTMEFIRKWGSSVKHTPLMKPIVSPKYNIGIVLENSNYQLLSILEPWCDRIYVDSDFESYIQREQKATSYDLTKRITSIQTPTEEIVIHINGNSFNNNDYNVIQNISDIINDSGAIGQFELGNLKLDIREMNEYQNTLIYV